MTDARSMLFAQPGDHATLEELDRQAFVTSFWNVTEQGLGPIDLLHVATTLGHGEGLFVDKLSTLGTTQESVVEVLEMLVLQHRMRVFVLDGQRLGEMTPDIVKFLQQFRRLDVILINRAA